MQCETGFLVEGRRDRALGPGMGWAELRRLGRDWSEAEENVRSVTWEPWGGLCVGPESWDVG